MTPIPLALSFKHRKPESCRRCVGATWGMDGFMPESEGPTHAWNGVLLVGEALTEIDAQEGRPFAGRAGLALSQMLQRGGLRREHFAIDNALRCRPPGDKLARTPYEHTALDACAPHLDGTIARHRPRAIVALGDVALRRLLGVHAFGKGDGITKRRGFPEWSERYRTWVVPTFHPQFLARGNRHLTTTFLDDIRKATRIAQEGFTPLRPLLLTDPGLDTVERYVAAFEAALARGEDVSLAVDIETPYKADEEDEASLEFDDPTYTILRVGFCWSGTEALSLAWLPHYHPYIIRLLRSRARKLTWNGRYDMPRLIANGMVIGGEEWDLMWAWHIRHSSLPKSLNFVASVVLHEVTRWKHLAKTEGARYNAFDALVTWLLEKPIITDIRGSDLWPVFDRHILQLDEILKEMSAKGVLIDQEWRTALAKDLLVKVESVQREMEGVIPRAVRRSKIFAGTPKSVEGLVEEIHTKQVKVCARCGQLKPTKSHFKVFKKKENPCGGADAITVEKALPTWVRLEPFVPSNKQMIAYARFHDHTMVQARKKPGDEEGVEKWTFDDDSIKTMMRRYPQDPLYPRVREYREHETLAARYVGWWDAEKGEALGGCEIGPDGRMHTTFLHNPSTLRLSSQAPALQNWPRGDDNALARRVRGMVIADPGEVLVEFDYKAIEAQLVGWFANSWNYIRLSKMGVHDFLNGHILAREGKIAKAPDLRWSDADLKACFKDLKKHFPTERNVAKRIVHGSNYLMSPRRMADLYPELFPAVRNAVSLQGLYFDLFPELRDWHFQIIETADNGAALRNPFGYLHYFFHVKEWFKHDGKWAWRPGDDAKSAIAFLPQSTAAVVIKEAMLRLKAAGLVRYLRVQVHDSLLNGIPRPIHRDVARWIAAIMEEPVLSLPLEKFGLPGHLAIEVECKVGERWGEGMEEISLAA